MKRFSVGLFGASGYAGIEATRILGHHPSLEVAFLASDRAVGRKAGDAIGPCGAVGERVYVSVEEGVAAASACDVVICATPPEASERIVSQVRGSKARIVDLSAAFRFADGTIYGLPERSREAIARAAFVANPGCYPTAAALALAPLVREGVIERASLVVDAMSGVSGAGRRASEEYSFVEVANDARAYKVLAHPHRDEIARSLAVDAAAEVDVVFTPHLVPMARGILCTSYASLARPASTGDLLEVMRAAYRAEPFVRVLDSPDAVSVARVAGTNECAIGVACEKRRVVVISAIDNLIKGAAGQAIQNVNVMLGLDERAGLDLLRRVHP